MLEARANRKVLPNISLKLLESVLHILLTVHQLFVQVLSLQHNRGAKVSMGHTEWAQGQHGMQGQHGAQHGEWGQHGAYSSPFIQEATPQFVMQKTAQDQHSKHWLSAQPFLLWCETGLMLMLGVCANPCSCQPNFPLKWWRGGLTLKCCILIFLMLQPS